MRIFIQNGNLVSLTAAALLLATLGPALGCKRPAADTKAELQAAHDSFDSAQSAVDAFVVAMRANDEEKLASLLGPGSDEFLDTGDSVADEVDRTRFLELYDLRHELVEEDGHQILQIGDKYWPLPIPIVERDGRWYLDGAAGTEELIYRNVGRNELGAIAVCRGFVDSQYEYAATGHDGRRRGIYAAFLISDPGTENGLYWPAEEGKPRSPAGPMVAAAAAEGYRRAAAGEPTPYHGYFYRMLYAQGADAPAGAKDYFVDGQLVNGFGLVAWPASYGTSGVMSFLVNQEGDVYQKDLGADTATEANQIRLFNPDATWSKLADDDE